MLLRTLVLVSILTVCSSAAKIRPCRVKNKACVRNYLALCFAAKLADGTGLEELNNVRTDIALPFFNCSLKGYSTYSGLENSAVSDLYYDTAADVTVLTIINPKLIVNASLTLDIFTLDEPVLTLKDFANYIFYDVLTTTELPGRYFLDWNKRRSFSHVTSPKVTQKYGPYLKLNSNPRVKTLLNEMEVNSHILARESCAVYGKQVTDFYITQYLIKLNKQQTF